MFQIRHQVPGRVRYKIISGDQTQTTALVDAVAKLAGVEHARLNAACSSLIIHYTEGSFDPAKLAASGIVETPSRSPAARPAKTRSIRRSTPQRAPLARPQRGRIEQARQLARDALPQQRRRPRARISQLEARVTRALLRRTMRYWWSGLLSDIGAPLRDAVRSGTTSRPATDNRTSLLQRLRRRLRTGEYPRPLQRAPAT